MRIPLKTKTERRNKATLFSFSDLSILLKCNFDNSVGVVDCISFFCKEERSFLRCPSKGIAVSLICIHKYLAVFKQNLGMKDLPSPPLNVRRTIDSLIPSGVYTVGLSAGSDFANALPTKTETTSKSIHITAKIIPFLSASVSFITYFGLFYEAMSFNISDCLFL